MNKILDLSTLASSFGTTIDDIPKECIELLEKINQLDLWENILSQMKNILSMFILIFLERGCFKNTFKNIV